MISSFLIKNHNFYFVLIYICPDIYCHIHIHFDIFIKNVFLLAVLQFKTNGRK